MPLCCYLLPWKNRGYQVLSFIVSRNTLPIRSKFPDRKFTGVPIMNFIPDWESEITNQSGLQTSPSEN